MISTKGTYSCKMYKGWWYLRLEFFDGRIDDTPPLQLIYEIAQFPHRAILSLFG